MKAPPWQWSQEVWAFEGMLSLTKKTGMSHRSHDESVENLLYSTHLCATIKRWDGNVSHYWHRYIPTYPPEWDEP